MPEGSIGPAVRPSLARASDAPVVAWRRAGLVFAVALAALLGIYRESLLELVDGWNRSGTFAHGWIIFPASAWMIWRLRAELAVLAPRTQPLAVVPALACGLVWLVGDAAGVRAPMLYGFVAMIPCLVWGVFGTAIAKRIAFPLAFLLLSVPVGDFLMPTLMDHTADFTVAALRLSGVPVYREGNYFSIPSGNWSVIEACSGLRYLIASITLGFLFAYLNYRSPLRRAGFVLASILVPILANWLRAYGIVMLAHLTNNQLATGVDHIVYGWLFFGVVMLILFWVGSLWREDEDAPTPTTAPVAPGIARVNAWVAVALVVVVMPWPVLANRLEAVAAGTRPGAIEIDVPGWTTGGAAATPLVPHYQRERAGLTRTFASDGRRVDLFVAYYSGQNTHGSMLTFDNDVVLVGDPVWGRIGQREVDADFGGHAVPVEEIALKRGGEEGTQQFLAWRWYWVNGRVTTDRYLAKFWTAVDKLAGRGDDSAVVVATVPMTDPATARSTLAAFTAAAGPALDARLAAVRAQAHR